MAKVSVPLDLATDAQIRLFGEIVGVEFEPRDNRGTLLSKLAMAFTGDSILIPEEEVRNQQGSAPNPPASAGDDPFNEAIGTDLSTASGFRDDPYVTITLDTAERDGEVVSTGGGITGARDATVGVNGKVFQIKRGVPARVPYRVYLALKNAERQSITMDSNTGDMNETMVAMYSITSVENMPTAAEIADWHRRVDHVELA